ncbi:MAG TPA: permease-like cell division protein FtsX [Candidatus Limnocylindrales bacterium]|nr:permease-like cell division protein FtsX [Candidatus Limnocylindrales bacterium]HEU4918587.1 permease-like cell division protein FtsX [Candidatus Limnocylindrales bacterium]
MLTFVIFSLKRAWQGFWRNAVMSIAATATMVLMLLLLAGFWILQTGLQASLDYTESKVEVVADLKDNVKDEEVEPIVERLLAMPEVTGITFVSEDEALERWRTRLAEQGEEDLSRYLDVNPLHASLEVKLAQADAYGEVVRALRAEQPVVEKVSEQQQLAENVVTVTNVLSTAGTVILVVIALIVLFIIVNTIRLAVFARAEEIEIMRLVGASDAFIRWPFVFEGAMVGLLGATITMLALWLGSEPLGEFMVGFFQVLPLTFGTLARDLLILVGGAGVGLGILGSWLSVRTYLIR